jgi:hypothetical protein
MRWDRLLGDIEAAEDARARAEMLGEAAERSRLETARVTLESRLAAAAGSRLTIDLDGAGRCSGVVTAVGRGWVVLDAGQVSWVVAVEHIRWVADLGRNAAPPPSAAGRRIYDKLGIAHVLRGIATDRAAVQLGLGAGETLAGTIDRVGADFVDVAVHAVGEPRRPREVRGRRTVRTAAIRFVRRSGIDEPAG